MAGGTDARRGCHRPILLRPHPRQQSLLELLEQRGGRAWLSTLTTAERFSRSVVEGLERQGQLRRRAVAAGSAEFMTLQAAGVAAVDGTAGTLEPPQAPSAAQRQALERLAATPPGGALLLWG
ncbi:hypothetical protein [Cyanobium sp. ATX-6F1]|uniref:hypothetical protein n=1 Tax=Cyanobium sp. ATX-6F1 TaxID=3137388 RepID=UPI0039BE25DA